MKNLKSNEVINLIFKSRFEERTSFVQTKRKTESPEIVSQKITQIEEKLHSRPLAKLNSNIIGDIMSVYADIKTDLLQKINYYQQIKDSLLGIKDDSSSVVRQYSDSSYKTTTDKVLKGLYRQLQN